MAQSVEEIKKTMTDSFLQNKYLREAYGITGEYTTWEEVFSVVSIENIFIYIVAVCNYALQVMFDRFRRDVDDRIARNIVPTTRYYHTQALAFQYGDGLVYDDATQSFKYAVEDSSKKVVKYCAVMDQGNSIRMLVSGDESGLPTPLSNAVLTAFKSYINAIKIAGVLITIDSLKADNIKMAATIQVDPQVIDTTGTRINDGAKPVVDAINSYLAGIVYGGTFNKTKCVDAIQAVDGVLDVTLDSVEARTSSGNYAPVTGNNYTAYAGCFISEDLDNSITYVV